MCVDTSRKSNETFVTFSKGNFKVLSLWFCLACCSKTEKFLTSLNL